MADVKSMYLVVSVACAVATYAAISFFSTRSIIKALKMTKETLKWEFTTDAGRCNIAGTVLLFVLILAYPILDFIISLLGLPLHDAQEAIHKESVALKVYICFSLYTFGSIILTAYLERHR